MSTDKQEVEESAASAEGSVATPADGDVVHEAATDSGTDTGTRSDTDSGTATGAQEPGPSWWHRDHPTFSALAGFFTGLAFVALVPAIYVGVLSLFFDSDRVEDLFPFVLVTLVVPLALVTSTRTRRFGIYFWIGMLLTAVVVVGVGALVLWYLVEHQS